MSIPINLPPLDEMPYLRFKEPPQWELRALVLKTSLYAEQVSINLACSVLGINHEDSELFSNTAKAIPYMQRITLLMEIGAVNEKQKQLFTWFATIRNQAAHNFAAKSVTDFLKADQHKALIKEMNAEGNDPELQLTDAIKKLNGKIQDLVYEIARLTLRRKAMNFSHHHGMTVHAEALTNALSAEVDTWKHLLAQMDPQPTEEIGRLRALMSNINKRILAVQELNMLKEDERITLSIFHLPEIKHPSDPKAKDEKVTE